MEGANRITERHEYQRQQRGEEREKKKEKSLGRSEGVGNKGGGSDGSRDVTVCEDVKHALQLRNSNHRDIFNKCSCIIN